MRKKIVSLWGPFPLVARCQYADDLLIDASGVIVGEMDPPTAEGLLEVLAISHHPKETTCIVTEACLISRERLPILIACIRAGYEVFVIGRDGDIGPMEGLEQAPILKESEQVAA